MLRYSEFKKGIKPEPEGTDDDKYHGSAHDFQVLKDTVGWKDFTVLLLERLELIRNELEDPGSDIDVTTMVTKMAILRQEAQDIRFFLELPDKTIEALNVESKQKGDVNEKTDNTSKA